MEFSHMAWEHYLSIAELEGLSLELINNLASPFKFPVICDNKIETYIPPDKEDLLDINVVNRTKEIFKEKLGVELVIHKRGVC